MSFQGTFYEEIACWLSKLRCLPIVMVIFMFICTSNKHVCETWERGLFDAENSLTHYVFLQVLRYGTNLIRLPSCWNEEFTYQFKIDVCDTSNQTNTMVQSNFPLFLLWYGFTLALKIKMALIHQCSILVFIQMNMCKISNKAMSIM